MKIHLTGDITLKLWTSKSLTTTSCNVHNGKEWRTIFEMEDSFQFVKKIQKYYKLLEVEGNLDNLGGTEIDGCQIFVTLDFFNYPMKIYTLFHRPWPSFKTSPMQLRIYFGTPYQSIPISMSTPRRRRQRFLRFLSSSDSHSFGGAATGRFIKIFAAAVAA